MLLAMGILRLGLFGELWASLWFEGDALGRWASGCGGGEGIVRGEVWGRTLRDRGDGGINDES